MDALHWSMVHCLVITFCCFFQQDNSLRHKNTNLCIEVSEDGQKVDMKPCTGTDRQIWQWRRKTAAELQENQQNMIR